MSQCPTFISESSAYFSYSSPKVEIWQIYSPTLKSMKGSGSATRMNVISVFHSVTKSDFQIAHWDDEYKIGLSQLYLPRYIQHLSAELDIKFIMCISHVYKKGISTLPLIPLTCTYKHIVGGTKLATWKPMMWTKKAFGKYQRSTSRNYLGDN